MLAKRKMTLTELSRIIGISVPTLSLLKTGKVKALNMSTIEDLCRILECKPGDLIDYISDEEYKKLMKI
jgi:putative transcriptional regulator